MTATSVRYDSAIETSRSLHNIRADHAALDRMNWTGIGLSATIDVTLREIGG